jgi:hypothetical protein
MSLVGLFSGFAYLGLKTQETLALLTVVRKQLIIQSECMGITSIGRVKKPTCIPCIP